MHIYVLMFCYYFPPHHSGAALQAINLSKCLKQKGIDIVFLTANHNGLPEYDEVEGFKVFRIREGKGDFGELLLWKNIWILLKRKKIMFDIIHSHGAYLRNSFIGPFSKLFGKKSLAKVSLAHNDLHGLGKGKSGWIHKRFISMVDRYVSISAEITNELRQSGLSDGKISVIPNGVDTERFSPVSSDEKMMLRSKYGLPQNSLMLLYAGGLSGRKNITWLVEQWENIYHNYPGFLVIVGPISRDDKAKQLFSRLKDYEDKLKGRLFIFPYSKEIEEFFRMTDIFILPSINEGMPNVVLEAMSSGLSCLVNRVSGTVDLLNGENGILFSVRTPETFVDGLHSLKDKCLRAKMGEKARETIIRNFSLEIIAERYIRLYENMLA